MEESTVRLMNQYGKILEELKNRGVIRTYNSPVGDYAEWLVSNMMGLTLENNSCKGYDAIDTQGIRYQIKSRWERGRPTMKNRQLSFIRDYEEHPFDFLIVLIFDAHFAVREAYQIPWETVGCYARYNRHINGHLLSAWGGLLKDPRTQDITRLFQHTVQEETL